MNPPKIISAQVIGDRTLLIEFSQSEVKKYDVSKLLDNPMFTKLQNPSFFKNFQIESGGYGLIWNEDIDISEYELWKNGETFYEIMDLLIELDQTGTSIALIACD